MTIRGLLKGTAALVLGGLLFFVFGWVPYFLGGLATTRRFQFPDKENAGVDPKALGLPFESVALRSSDGWSSRAGGCPPTRRAARSSWCTA